MRPAVLQSARRGVRRTVQRAVRRSAQRAVRRAGIVAADWLHVAGAMARAVVDSTGPDALASGRRTPIVLVPGIWEPWRFMLPLARRLHGLGHPVRPLPTLGWNGVSLEDSLERIRDALPEAAPAGAVVVAHSKGGLIGKRLLAEPEAGARLAGMVAVCSPFGGSSLAWRGLARTPLGMFSPGGAVIRGLARDLATNARIISIGSAWDEMIPQGTHLEGAVNVTVDVAGHFRPLDDAGVAGLVHDHVERLTAARLEAGPAQ